MLPSPPSSHGSSFISQHTPATSALFSRKGNASWSGTCNPISEAPRRSPHSSRHKHWASCCKRRETYLCSMSRAETISAGAQEPPSPGETLRPLVFPTAGVTRPGTGILQDRRPRLAVPGIVGALVIMGRSPPQLLLKTRESQRASALDHLQSALQSAKDFSKTPIRWTEKPVQPPESLLLRQDLFSA